MRKRKGPLKILFPRGLNFDKYHSATNDKPIIHFQREESNRRRPSLYGCTTGAGNTQAKADVETEPERAEPWIIQPRIQSRIRRQIYRQDRSTHNGINPSVEVCGFPRW